MVTNRKSKVSSTRISGDHEFTGVEITQALNANGFVGNSPSAKAHVMSKTCEQLVELLANEDITDLATFVTYATSDGQVGFQAIDMTVGESHAKARVTVTSASYVIDGGVENIERYYEEVIDLILSVSKDKK